MDAAWWTTSSIKAAIALAASGLVVMLLRHSTAEARHRIWTLGVMAALAVPVLSLAVPGLVSVDTPLFGAARSLHADAVVVSGTGAADPDGAISPFAVLWACGAIVIALRGVRGQIAARRLAQRSEPARSALWLSACREAAASVGVTRAVSLRRSTVVASPMTLGLLRPQVLLPAAADGWSPERLRAVLLHELGHVARHDVAIQLCAQIACALYWWNPLVWLAASRLHLEREVACDDLVLAAGVRPSSYAADLLDVTRALATHGHPHPPVGACMATLSRHEARLRHVLDATRSRTPIGVGFRAAATGITGAIVATLACTSASASLPVSHGLDVSIGVPSVKYGAAPATAWLPSRTFRPPPAASDAIDLALVVAEVKRHLGDVQRCYERRLSARPQLAGTIVIHWIIAMDGRPAEQCITSDTVGDPDLVACVNTLVSDGRFPSPRGETVDVTLPFVFVPVDR